MNIRAKGAAPTLPQQPPPSRSLPTPDGDSNAPVPPIPPHIKTTPVAPPLLPRVSRLSSAPHHPKSISNTHVPVTIQGRSSRSELGRSSSSAAESHHVHLGVSGAM